MVCAASSYVRRRRLKRFGCGTTENFSSSLKAHSADFKASRSRAGQSYRQYISGGRAHPRHRLAVVDSKTLDLIPVLRLAKTRVQIAQASSLLATELAILPILPRRTEPSLENRLMTDHVECLDRICVGFRALRTRTVRQACALWADFRTPHPSAVQLWAGDTELSRPVQLWMDHDWLFSRLLRPGCTPVTGHRM